MKNMRHVVNVMRPTGAHESRGQLEGAPTCVLKGWQCSIETLSGRELDLAHTKYAEASHKIEGYGDPRKPFTERDWLEFVGPDGCTRTFWVGVVMDRQQNGIELSLLCEEIKDG